MKDFIFYMPSIVNVLPTSSSPALNISETSAFEVQTPKF